MVRQNTALSYISLEGLKDRARRRADGLLCTRLTCMAFFIY